MTSRENSNIKDFTGKFLPIETIPLWIGIFILTPVTIITFSGVQKSIIDWMEALMKSLSPDNLGTEIVGISIPWGILLFTACGLLTCLILFATAQTISIKNWYLSIDKKKTLSGKEFTRTLKDLTGWMVYRFFYVGYPIFAIGAITLLLVFFVVNFFNIIAQIMGTSLELVLILAIFFGLSLVLFWGVAICLSIWNLITTAFGNTIAITDNNISYNTIIKRSRRFAFLKKEAWFTYTLYLMLISSIIIECLLLFIKPELNNLLKIIIIIALGTFNTGALIMIGKSITSYYYKSMLVQLSKITVKKPAGPLDKTNPFDHNANTYFTP